jgi:hypothetical protein
MSVRVSIDVHGWEMDFDRGTAHAFGDGPSKRFRDAAAVLDQIAADIRRMYPLGDDAANFAEAFTDGAA